MKDVLLFVLTLWHWHWRCIGVGVSRTYRRWLVTLQPCLLLAKLFNCLVLLSFITNVLVVRYWASARQTIQRKLRPGSSFNNPPNKKTYLLSVGHSGLPTACSDTREILKGSPIYAAFLPSSTGRPRVVSDGSLPTLWMVWNIISYKSMLETQLDLSQNAPKSNFRRTDHDTRSSRLSFRNFSICSNNLSMTPHCVLILYAPPEPFTPHGSTISTQR